MQRFQFSAFGVLSIFILVVFSCKHDPIISDPIDPVTPVDTTNGGGGGGSTGVLCDPDSIYFQNQVLPILVSNCTEAGCHNAQDAQEGIVLTSYASLMSTVEHAGSPDWDENELLEVITENDPDKRMPQSPNTPLTQDQINLIAGWIAQGARDNGCNENSGGCATDNVSFTAFVQPLVQARCQGCHGGSAPQGGIDLTSYNKIKTVALNGKLYAAITRTSNWMPRGGTKLDDCTAAKIKAWVDAGAPQN